MGDRLTTIDMGRKLGAVPLWGRGAVAMDEAYLRAKFHLDPSNRLATTHQRHRQATVR